MTCPSASQSVLSSDEYQWIPQACPTCEVMPTRRLGRRGGSAHRSGAGVTCFVWCCDSCGLIFPNPMPVPRGGLDQHYALDPADYFCHHDVDKKGRAASLLLAQAAELTGGVGAVLDIGAGRGELLRAARLAGWSITGIEPSPAFADYAARHSGVAVLQTPVEECSLPTESFDVVIMAAVLEHLYNPDATMKEISRILRPGGVLFLDVPNECGLYFRIGNLYQRFRKRDWVVNLAPTFSPFHTFGFGPRSLRALLHKHRLQPVDWRIYGGSSLLPDAGSATGKIEALASDFVTWLSRFGEHGTYIETWARRLP